MKFEKKNPVRLVNKRSGMSKKGNAYTMLTVADIETFENVDFFPSEGLDVASLEVGQNYTAVVDVTSRFSSVFLYPIGK